MTANDDETLRLLCMGDNHGDVTSLERVVDETNGEEFDFVIHVGDITNAWFDGVDEGREQLEAITPQFEALNERGELLYIWGNRDGAIGPERPFQDYDLPGTFIPEDDVITVAGETFTQDLELVEDDTILVTHYWYPELLDHFAGKAYFSGHIHTGRYKNKALNTAFLYRTADHGADALLGAYFVVEIAPDGAWQIDFRNIGKVRKGICPRHQALGVQFVPDYWRKDCQFCYDEDDFYSEVARSALYGLGTVLEEADVEEVVEFAASSYGATPLSFESKLRSFLEERAQEE